MNVSEAIRTPKPIRSYSRNVRSGLISRDGTLPAHPLY